MWRKESFHLRENLWEIRYMSWKSGEDWNKRVCLEVFSSEKKTKADFSSSSEQTTDFWNNVDTWHQRGVWRKTQKSQQSWNCLVIKNCQSFSIKMSVMDKVMQESSSWCWWRRCWSSRTTFLYVWTFSNKDSANPNDFLLMDTFQPQFQP